MTIKNQSYKLYYNSDELTDFECSYVSGSKFNITLGFGGMYTQVLDLESFCEALNELVTDNTSKKVGDSKYTLSLYPIEKTIWLYDYNR